MHTDGTWFKDDYGRTLLLRGVNLGGSTKVPYQPDGATYRREGFFDHRTVSFVGRPFPLEEADEHLGRLREWGLTFLRFLVPAVRAPTVVFVPNYQYPRGYMVEVSDGAYEIDRDSQTLIYRHGTDQDVHHLRVRSIS